MYCSPIWTWKEQSNYGAYVHDFERESDSIDISPILGKRGLLHVRSVVTDKPGTTLHAFMIFFHSKRKYSQGGNCRPWLVGVNYTI